jgi:hypothetical protein
MSVISRFQGIMIAMYFDDHNPPHFHARYGDFKVSINILDFTILDGNLPSKELNLVLNWATYHQIELLENWDNARNGVPLNKIDPP